MIYYLHRYTMINMDSTLKAPALNIITLHYSVHMKSICDDVAIVGEAQSAAQPARALCSIAAGVSDFALMIDEPDGIYGIAQWFPGRTATPELGPPEDRFVAVYSSRTHAAPDYPAVQAVAAATLATHCAESAGSLDAHALWAAATSLRTTTLLGEFGIDADTGAQTKHRPSYFAGRANSCAWPSRR